MIPRKIHWCWLSGDPLPKRLQKCLDSWKRVMPDYEIILWDTNRFDIHSVKFVEDACAARKWAFAADYIRLYALYTEGGIYLDSDVKVFRRFDPFLHHSAFSAIEYAPSSYALRTETNPNIGYGIQAAVIGAKKGNGWIEKCMEYYMHTEFKTKEGGGVALDRYAPDVIAHYAHTDYGFQYDLPYNKAQYLKDNIVIYPHSVFPLLNVGVSLHSYVIHLNEISWQDDKLRHRRKKKSRLQKFYRELRGDSRLLSMLHCKMRQFFKACGTRTLPFIYRRLRTTIKQ